MEQEEMLNKKKLGVHEHELRTLEAFGRDLPKVLDSPSTDLSTQNTSLDKSRLSNARNYQDWENPGFLLGLRQKIESNLLSIFNSVNSAIDMEFKNHPFVIALVPTGRGSLELPIPVA